MKKQLDCKHFFKEAKKTSFYSYDLINADLNLCIACERKLRKQILNQDKIEHDPLITEFSKRKINKPRRR